MVRLDDGLLRLARHTVAATAELDAVDVRGDRVHLRVRPPGVVEPGFHLLLLDTEDQVLVTLPATAHEGLVETLIAVDDLPAGYFGMLRLAVGKEAAWVRIRRRDNDLADPHHAVLLPGAVRAWPGTRRAPGCGGTPTGCSRSARSTRTRPAEAGVKVTFLTQSAHKLGGTERSAITQANALVAAGHDIRILSVVKAADEPVFAIDDRVVVEHLVDLTVTYDEELHARPSLLVPERWDKQFSALTDVGLEQGLRGLATDVLVTVTPALLACALELAPDSVVVVHQEHRSSSQRTSGMEPLLVNAPRADVVALLTPSIAEWLRGQLGAVAPEIVVMQNPLPQGFAPRSLLDSRTIVAAGRLVMEKQYTKLVEAFADVADQLPGWRLRILGQGHQRPHLVRETRKRGLWDRVELPVIRLTCPASGAGRASARSPPGPRRSRSGCRRRWRPVSPL